MDYRDEVINEALKAKAEMPGKRNQIIDAVEWTLMEIDNGESESNEYELFMGQLEEIRKGKEP